MQIHGSCVARDGAGLLLLGPSGCGKSDLVLRLLACGFVLVADDRVILEFMTDRWRARAPDALAGLLEIRGLGIIRLPHAPDAALALAVNLGVPERLPPPRRMAGTNLPMVTVDPMMASAPLRVGRALDCALGLTAQIAGAFTPAEIER